LAYGCITTKDLVNIFNSQNESPTDNIEFENALKPISETIWEIVYWGDYVSDTLFSEEGMEYGDLERFTRRVSGIPRYIPPKEHFLMYGEFPHEEEPCSQKDTLEEFLLEEVNLEEREAEFIVSELEFLFKTQPCTKDDITEVLEDSGVELSAKHSKKFLTLSMDMNDNIRQWFKNGHTPKELREKFTIDPVFATKVGRNDPCPCGNGKKYKQCCLK
jgi:hypothetical protein